MPLLEVQHLQKVYTSRFGGSQVEALQNVNFSVEPGEYVAIMGESGSGKTTLLNILAALDRPTVGEVFLNGKALSDVRERDLAAFRRSHLGFVFQDFNLLDTFSLRDNIFLPLVLAGRPYEEMERKLKPLAEQLGIADSGIGIREEDQARVFEKGFTGYNGRADKKSTGIGLYLCRQVMDRLNHGISLTSRPGQGTLVRLDLGRESRMVE